MNGFGVIRAPTCRSGRVMWGWKQSIWLVVRPWCYPVAQVPYGCEKKWWKLFLGNLVFMTRAWKDLRNVEKWAVVVKVVLESGGHGKKGWIYILSAPHYMWPSQELLSCSLELVLSCSLELVDGHEGHFFTLVDSGQTLGSCCLGTRSIPTSLMLTGHKLCKCTSLFNPVFLPSTVKYTLEPDPILFKMETAHCS